MSKYGITPYATDYYGPAASSLYDSNPTATPVGFSRVRIDWSTPGGTWSRIRLVRNSYGYPSTAYDGTVLVDSNSGPSATGTIDNAVNNYLDSSGLVGGKFYYYSLFVLVSTGLALTWKRSGNVQALAVYDYSYGSYLIDRLPNLYRGSASEGSVTENFMNLLGTDLSRLRSLMDHTLYIEDPDVVAGNLLPLLSGNFGIAYEPEIPMRQNRILLKNAAYLSQIRGTTSGITGFASALTGYGAEQLGLTNLFLNTDDAAFLNGIGLWSSSGTALSIDTGGTVPTDPVLGTTLNVQPVTVPVSGGSVTAIYGGKIPVTAGSPYVFSIFTRVDTGTDAQVTLNVEWLDSTGAAISTLSGTATAITSAWGRQSFSTTAPTGALHAVPSITWTDPSAGNEYLTAVQFEPGTVLSPWVQSRKIDISLLSERVNEVINPGFDSNTYGWTGTNATLAQETTITSGGGAGALSVTPTTTGTATTGVLTGFTGTPGVFSAGVPYTTTTTTSSGLDCAAYTTIAVDPSRSLAVSAVIYPTVSGDFSITVDWKDSGGTLISSYNSPSNSLTAGSFQQISGVTSSPPLATSAVVTFTCFGGLGLWYLDDVQAEHASVVKTYFDPRYNPGEVLFEGTYAQSRSHLYPEYAVKKARLLDLLVQNVPVGSFFSIFFALPRGVTTWADLSTVTWSVVSETSQAV